MSQAIQTHSTPLLRALASMPPLAPLTRPPIPAYDKLAPTMPRAAWLDRARHEHRVFGLAVSLLDQYDSDLAHIVDDLPAEILEFDNYLRAAQEHYSNGLEVIYAARSRISVTLAGDDSHNPPGPGLPPLAE